MLQVGAPGQTGDVEMQDLMFTTKGATPGAILVQWNMKASKPGSAGIWGMYYLRLQLVDIQPNRYRLSCSNWWRIRHLVKPTRVSTDHERSESQLSGCVLDDAYHTESVGIL
jgi:hypothetical protein